LETSISYKILDKVLIISKEFKSLHRKLWFAGSYNINYKTRKFLLFITCNFTWTKYCNYQSRQIAIIKNNVTDKYFFKIKFIFTVDASPT